MDEKTTQEIIKRYHENNYLSFVEIADDLKINYHDLVKQLQLLAKKIKFKVFNRQNNRNPHVLNVSPFLIDYYYIVDCDLHILAEVFGYSSARNVLRVMQKNTNYAGKNKNMFSERTDIPPFPQHTKRMRDRNKNKNKNKIKATK
jgi:hypothetical protein